MRLMISVATVGVLMLAATGAAGEASQSDWSGGGGVAGPAAAWGSAFDQAVNVSWLAVSGQLSLASIPRTDPARQTLAGSFVNQLTGGMYHHVGSIDGIVARVGVQIRFEPLSHYASFRP